MTNDDDVLGIDLDAWQPPPPPNVADGVIARMRHENTTVSAQALPVEAPPRAVGRRWWIAGGVAAAIAASTVITFALTRGPANARGISAGDRAAHIAIGPSSADVDAHTVLSWRREGDLITAKQAGGAAAWRVDDDDTLTIETGLASIQATNASLRVEVKMLDEKKTIALSALTAAAVAAVTIVVYEGAVKAGGTTVPPGTAYQITAKGENVIEDEITVAASDLSARIAALEAELAQKQAELDAVTNRTTVRASCDADALVARGQDLFTGMRMAEALETFEQAYNCKPDSSILKFVFVLACKSKNLTKARFYWKKMAAPYRDATLAFCVGNGISYEELEDPSPMGRLIVTNAEPARVLVDGVTVGTTPAIVEVAPGKHKVTFVVGADKYTFSVNVTAGETARLSKEVRQLE